MIQALEIVVQRLLSTTQSADWRRRFAGVFIWGGINVQGIICCQLPGIKLQNVIVDPQVVPEESLARRPFPGP